MVKSQVIIDRKDYIDVCSNLKKSLKTVNHFRDCKDDRLLEIIESRIKYILNILEE